MAGQYPYPTSLREEGLKNRVAKDWYSPFDCTRIIGNIDFCVDIPATELALGYEAEPVLWAEAKAGNRRDIVASVAYHWGNDLSGSRRGVAKLEMNTLSGRMLRQGLTDIHKKREGGARCQEQFLHMNVAMPKLFLTIKSWCSNIGLAH